MIPPKNPQNNHPTNKPKLIKAPKTTEKLRKWKFCEDGWGKGRDNMSRVRKRWKERDVSFKRDVWESKESLIQSPGQTSDLVSSVPNGVRKSLWLMSNFLIVECWKALLREATSGQTSGEPRPDSSCLNRFGNLEDFPTQHSYSFMLIYLYKDFLLQI